MNSIIKLQDISKSFKVVNHREGIKGSIRDLFSREYSQILAVNDVSIDVYEGEIAGFLGPNGAGKSTLIKMMTGILSPSDGQITVNGTAPHFNRTQYVKEIGVVFGQRSQLWWSLPVIESFKLLKDLYQVSGEQFHDILQLYDELVGAKNLYHKQIRQMSLGQRTLCDILAAFLHNPKVVFLDEPTIGLDVSMKAKIRNLIKALNEKYNTTIILTTHDMGDVEALCNRVVIIDHGKMIFDDQIDSLRNYFGEYRTLKIQFEATKENVTEQCVQIEDVLSKSIENFQDIVFENHEDWIVFHINERKVGMTELLNGIQKYKKISNIKIEEISIENIVKKIYEGNYL